MANTLVVRTQRRKKIGYNTSPIVYTLKRKARDAKMYDLERINFKVANSLRLVNDSITTTKVAPNSISFELVAPDGSSIGGNAGGNAGVPTATSLATCAGACFVVGLSRRSKGTVVGLKK